MECPEISVIFQTNHKLNLNKNKGKYLVNFLVVSSTWRRYICNIPLNWQSEYEEGSDVYDFVFYKIHPIKDQFFSCNTVTVSFSKGIANRSCAKSFAHALRTQPTVDSSQLEIATYYERTQAKCCPFVRLKEGSVESGKMIFCNSPDSRTNPLLLVGNMKTFL